jgi:hypothetical protein
MTVTWTACLDVLEANVTAAETALAAGEVPMTAPWEPPALDAQPEAGEVARMQGILTRLEQVLAAMAADQDGTRRELDQLDGRRAAARSYGASGFLTQSAQVAPHPADG